MKTTSPIVVQTADGSHTLYAEQYEAHYHSLNGAIQESQHIYIKNGYEYLPINGAVSILEVGLGTCLNAALTAIKTIERKQKTSYIGVELHPLEDNILAKLNYYSVLSKKESEAWGKIVDAKWGVENPINEFFYLTKLHADICTLNLLGTYDLIYFDAFAPEDQPEVWSEEIFEKIYKSTNKDGILVTYCSKGIVKQALRNVGYKVERLAGPPGKRHILRAIKL